MSAALELLTPTGTTWSRRRHPGTLAIIATLHIGAFYALATSTVAKTVHAKVRAVMLIPEIELPKPAPQPPPAQPKTKHATKAPETLPQRAPDAPTTTNLMSSATEQQPIAMAIQAPAPLTLDISSHSSPPAPPPTPPQPRPVSIELPSSDAQYLNNPIPTYPALSKRMNEQGRVVLRVLVNTEGKAERVELRTSSGFERLDTAALKAVSQWRFVPGKRGGVAEPMWFNVPVYFELS